MVIKGYSFQCMICQSYPAFAGENTIAFGKTVAETVNHRNVLVP